MPSSKGLRPHDVCVPLQLALKPNLTFRDLASDVGLSLGEAHNSKKRLESSRLLLPGSSPVNVRATLEFLSAGVPYVFPGMLGPESRGVATAYSAPPLSEEVQSSQVVVWASALGTVRGFSLEPLCRCAPKTAESNPQLYRLLTLVDGIRIGRARERSLARQHLETALKSVRAQ